MHAFRIKSYFFARFPEGCGDCVVVVAVVMVAYNLLVRRTSRWLQ